MARNYFELRGRKTGSRWRAGMLTISGKPDLTNALLEGGRGTELDTSRARHN